MERREAQHPGGRPRKPAESAVRAPGAGFATPSSNLGARTARSQGWSKGASQAPGASRRSIPLFGEKEKGTGLPGADQRIRAIAHVRSLAFCCCRRVQRRLKTNHAICLIRNQAWMLKNLASACVPVENHFHSKP